MRTDTALLLALGLACGSLAGCTVGPDPQVPATPLGPLHNAAAVEARTAAAPAPPLDRWWTGFDDAELTRIVERALAQNLDLTAALARVEQSRAVARQAGARLLPNGELTAQAVPLHQSLEGPLGTVARPLPGYDRNQMLYDLGAGASWEVDLFGGLRRDAEAARAEAEAAEADRLGLRVSIAAEAADAYLQIRGGQARLRLADRQIDTDARLLDLIRLRFSRGAAAEREIAQAEALLAQARATVPPLKMAIDAQTNRLDVLLGAQPGTYGAELAAPAEIPAAPAIGGGEQAPDLLRRRPDVVAAEHRLAASTARIGAAVAEYYPRLSLSALLGFESLSASRLVSAQAFQPEGVAGLRWRLFDFGRVDAEVAAAKGAEAEALARYRQSVLAAAEDVENAFMALVQLEGQADELAHQVDALGRARDTSEEDYKAGAIALTDVLDADRDLLTAQDALARTRADSARAAVASFRALGGGW